MDVVDKTFALPVLKTAFFYLLVVPISACGFQE